MFKETVSSKKKFLSSLIKAPLAQIVRQSTVLWPQRENLTAYLAESLCQLPHCQLLYAINPDGKQYSGNVTRYGVDNSWIDQDLSGRPFMSASLPLRGMILSAAYLSQRSMQPCITVMHAINHEGCLLGFLAADFHLKDLPVICSSTLHRMNSRSSQQQPTSKSRLKQSNNSADLNIDYLIYALSTMMQEHGIFHCNIDFNHENCHLWSVQDAFQYKLHPIDEVMSSELLDKYPLTDYQRRNCVASEKIPLIFAQFKALRQADDTVFLLSGSINLVNGLIGLNFSCDMSYYLSVDEFLNHDIGYWLNQDHLPEYQVITQSTQN